MRRLLSLVLSLAALSGVAFADTLTLAAPVSLRAKAGARRPVVATAPAGADVSILRAGPDWSSVAFEGKRYYAATPDLTTTSPVEGSVPDPGCDKSYPYSGAGRFFARPLARLRHSEPLGALFGYHRFDPC